MTDAPYSHNFRTFEPCHVTVTIRAQPKLGVSSLCIAA